MSTLHQPAPAKKVRGGRCKAYPFCRRVCEAFASSGMVGNFASCVCGHTQDVHEITQ